MAIDAYHEAAAERAVKKEKAPPTMRNGEGRVYTTPLAEPAPTRYSFTATHDKWTVIEMVQGRCIFMHVTDLGRHDRNGHDVAVEVGGINQGAWIPFTEYLAAVHAHRTPFDAGFLRVRTVGDEPIDMTFEFRPWGTCDTRS
ncbi:MAG TPA: hypothetical protein VFS75_01290 [Candidatus Paceibacterota bacterium]|nr:hypothetical protein [Candidatus Paceibacterota bacterium]